MISETGKSFSITNPILFSLGGDVKILNSEGRMTVHYASPWFYSDSSARYLRALCNVRNILLKQYKNGFRALNTESAFSLISSCHFPRSTISMIRGQGCDVLDIECIGLLSRVETLQRLITKQVTTLLHSLELGSILEQGIQELFTMATPTTEEELKVIADKFCNGMESYPCRLWVSDRFVSPTLLDSDEQFVNFVNDVIQSAEIDGDIPAPTPLLKQHFAILDRVVGHGDGKCSIAVDTQNVNPAQTFRLIKWLREQYSSVNFTLQLYGDGRESAVWKQAELVLGCPVMYHRSAVIRDSKSIVDTDVIAGVCSDYYARGFKSFIVISGDCDFMPLVRYLRDAAVCFVGSSQSISTKSVEFLRHNGAGFIFLDVFVNQLNNLVEAQVSNSARKDIMHAIQKMPLSANSVAEQIVCVARDRGCVIGESTAYEVLRDLLNTHTILLGDDGFFHLVRES